jgi:short-subunit dehydrogenase
MMRTIVVTGASSGIGRALALHCAGAGVHLAVLGRHRERLDEVATQCMQQGAQVTSVCADVRDAGLLRSWFAEFDAEHAIDLAIVNAGIMGGVASGEELERADVSSDVFTTNVFGSINTIHAVLPLMASRRRGQIAIIASLAAFIPLPDAPSYAASKAALLNYGLALRTRVRDQGVKINVVCPGYVKTPMTAQEQGWKPFEMSPHRAAELIIRGIDRNRPVISFPRFFSLITRLGGLLPEGIRRWTSQPFRFTVSHR